MIGRIARLIIVTLFAGLAGCSRDDSQRILGHWRAENIQVQGISLPMGPDFQVTPRELLSADGVIRIPLSSIESKGDLVTLRVPFGIGLSFYFESADRISFEVPLTGRVYFLRVANVVQSSRTDSAPVPVTATVPVNAKPAPEPPAAPPQARLPAASPALPAVEKPAQIASTVDLIRQAEQKITGNELLAAEALLGEARRQYGDDPMIDYHLAVLHMRQGDPDSAVRKLRDAFQNGWRDFSRLDASTELALLKKDPRYQALVTRYRAP